MLARFARTSAESLCKTAVILLAIAGCESGSRSAVATGPDVSPVVTPASAFNEADPATTPSPADSGPTGKFSLTVYSTADPATFSPQDLLQMEPGGGYYGGWSQVVSAPGFGVVREVRPMQLVAGMNRLEFTDVAAGIDPTTVAFTSLTAPDTTAVVEQNFDYDLASAQQLLRKYVGRDITLTLGNSSSPYDGVIVRQDSAVLRGTLLSVSEGSYVLRVSEPTSGLMLIREPNVVSVRLADSHTGFVIKPTLNWLVNATQAGEHQVQVTYQTDGLTWRSDYSLLIAPDEKTADLSAWVTLVNGSGISYPDASLKLVAGNVQRFVSPARQQRFGGTVFGQGGGGGQISTGFEEKHFFEYHLYTLGRTTSLNNNSTKQIELFTPKLHVPVEKIYVYDGLTAAQHDALSQQFQQDDGFGAEGGTTVDIYVRLKNSEANHLGIPLPAGRLRTYKIDAADGNREFIGEDVISHTPKDEEILARLGTAFELVGQRRQTDIQRNGNETTESFEITVRNHKDTAAAVIVRENMYRGLEWHILKASDEWKKIDSRTIHFPIEVPANGEKKITYTVKSKFW